MAEFMDCEQAAAAAKCSVYKIRDAIKCGELKAYCPGRAYLIEPSEFDRWVRSRAVGARKRPEEPPESK